MDKTTLEAERQVLGCLLMCPDAWGEVADILTPDSFGRDAHRIVYEALCLRAAAGEEWNLLSLLSQFEAAGRLNSVGGEDYLARLQDDVPSIEALPSYAVLVERGRKKRALEKIGIRLREVGDPDETRQEVEAELRAISAKEQEGWIPAGKLATSGLEEIDRRRQELVEGRVSGMSSSLPSLTRWTGGYRPGQVTFFAGRPAMGKSALLIQECVWLASKGHSVALMSLEMTSDMVCQRMLAGLSGVDAEKIRDGNVTHDEQDRLSQAGSMLFSLPLWVDARPATPGQLRGRLLALKARVGQIEAVGLDYLQMFRRDHGTRYGSRTEEVGEGAKVCQACAKDLSCAFLVAAQVGREVERRENKRPMMSDLRESGDIEAVADVIVGLYREGYYAKDADQGPIEAIVLKSRHGTLGTVRGTWDGPTQTIREIR